jgi:hypothetical protein
MTKKILFLLFFLCGIITINYFHTYIRLILLVYTYKVSHLRATARLEGARQLTTDIRGGSLSDNAAPPILLSWSCIGPWWLIDICRPDDRLGADDCSLPNSTPRRRVVSWQLYIRKWIEWPQKKKKKTIKTYRERSVRIITKYKLI